MSDDPILSPPPGYSVQSVLAQRPGLSVLRARRGEREVVLRLEACGEEAAAEFEVLAAVRHPGLARLVDHGPLEEQGRYVAREWIEGTALDALVDRRRPEALGRIVARLAQALDHLHGAGFVHGDLKAANVLVGAGDRPVLVDFGLAARAGLDRTVRGTLGHLAPEVLLGGAHDARGDLFALGVTLATILVPFGADAREFHARFPGRPFLEAAGIDPARLPDWARDLVVAATDRDPDRRPPSAAWMAQTLAARLGGVRRAAAAPLRLVWPVLEGRESFVDTRVRRLLQGEASLEAWTFHDPGEARRVGEATWLRAALGDPAVHGLDLRRAAVDCATTVALDRWALEQAGRGGLHVVWGVTPGGGMRALAALLGAARQRPRSRTLVCVPTGTTLDGLPARAFPGLTEQHIAARLHAWLGEADDEALTTLAERLHAECAGSAVRAEALLQAVIDEGWIRLDGKGLRLRTGRLPDHLARGGGRGARARGRDLPPQARRVVAALVVAGDPVSPGRLRAMTGLDGATLAQSGAAALAAGLIGTASDGRWFVPHPRPRRPDLGLDLEGWRALHAAAARAGAGDVRLRHRFASGEASAEEDLRAAARARRDGGIPERAVDLLTGALDDLRAAGELAPTWVGGELALAWAQVGDLDQAQRRAHELERDGGDVARAYAARVRARVASLRQRFGVAHELYQRAARLDPAVADEARLARARLAYEAGDDETLSRLAADLDQAPRPVAVNVRALAAMSALRRGEVEAARAALEASLAEVRALGEHTHEAALLQNLGVLARRTGDTAGALGHLRSALVRYEQDGDLPGVARAQLALGAALREAGDLVRSQEVLVEAVSTRERLGDRPGAERARGVLGLGLAERGHARAALDSLVASASALRRVGAEDDAARLAARAQEMGARLGRPVEEGATTHDPSVALAQARAAWLAGDPGRAREWARAAHERAQALGRARDAAEAGWLLARLDGLRPAQTGVAALDEDARLLERIAAEPLEASAALAQARALTGCGRDDRAVRLAAAVAARGPDADARRAGARLAREAFQRCAAGASDEERAALRSHLLGIPDPCPGDLAILHDSEPLEDDVDLLTLLDLNQRLVDQQDLPQLLGAIVESALEVTGAERGFLALEEDGQLHLDLAMDSIRGGLDVEEVEVSQTVLGEALASGKVLRVSNAAADPVLSAAPSVTELELRSILCCPFDVQPGLRGVVYIDHRVREGAFDERAERLLGLLAGQAALAIRQVRRLEEIRRLNAELEQRVVTRETDLRAAQRVLARSGLTVPIDGMVGESEAMRRVHELLRRVAPAELPVLIAGESGTGKELAARAVHDLSPRRAGPFVSENCAALPATIVESELFGHARGAFTGAESDRPGLFERAHGGTLFLDEVGELPLELQAKLLRVLETREVRRLGSEATLPVDFRLVAASNRDLATEVEAGRFRSDLMYRLDAVRVELPPLAERLDDLPMLVDHFLRLQAARDGVPRRCDPQVLRALGEREWPGNVRELANEVARLCVLTSGDLDDPSLLRAPQRTRETRASGPVVPLAELERQAILDAVARTGGDKRRAAELLGISRAKVYQRLKEWGAAEST